MDAKDAAILDRIEARAKVGKVSPYTPEELSALTKFWNADDLSTRTIEINRWLQGLNGR